MAVIAQPFINLRPRIHPPDVISKYARESIVGKLGSGGAPAAPAPAAVAAAPAAAAAQPLLNKGHEEMGISWDPKIWVIF